MQFHKTPGWMAAALMTFSPFAHAQTAVMTKVQQKTADGILEGIVSPDGKVRTFKGIPFAAPPVGPLRWKAPQPVTPWTGVRQAREFGPRCMQGNIYSDMIFHDAGPGEDCLYLNLWMPTNPPSNKLPVMVWIYGGGYQAGATSEGRQDGGNLAKHDVIIVSMNYRLGIFGFFSHPDLAKESGHNSSGNYGLLDQLAALQWVKNNIATFGGDPDNVTIFGESAGSFSVSALVASPLAKGLFQRAIGESGAYLSNGTLPMKPHAETEKADLAFAKSALGTDSLAELRAKPAAEILDAALKDKSVFFSPNVDGYFLPEDVISIFAARKQSIVPTLAGWNRDEQTYHSILHDDAPTAENFRKHLDQLYGANAGQIAKLYSGSNEADIKRAAQDLAGDRFIAFGTWKWLEVTAKTGKVPVYRYQFDQTLPLAPNAPADAEPIAPHASEIEFVFQMLFTRILTWRPEDHKVSDMMAAYWTNFAKSGNPNGEGLPQWPRYHSKANYSVMHLSASPGVAPDTHRARYLLLDSLH
jgi:para-nitrobenzyl esterase